MATIRWHRCERCQEIIVRAETYCPKCYSIIKQREKWQKARRNKKNEQVSNV